MAAKSETMKGAAIRRARVRAKAALERSLRDLSVEVGTYEALNDRYEHLAENTVDWKVRVFLEDQIAAVVSCLRLLSTRRLHRFLEESNRISTVIRNRVAAEIVAAEKEV